MQTAKDQLTALFEQLQLSEQQQQQTQLEQQKEQGSQHPLEVLYQEKDTLEHNISNITRALSLANQALELQQVIKQDADKLAATGQLIKEGTQQL